MNGNDLCPQTSKHYVNLNEILPDEYIAFSESFIDALWALPPPNNHTGKSDWTYLQDKEYDNTEITIQPHKYPNYVFLITDYDFIQCILDLRL